MISSGNPRPAGSEAAYATAPPGTPSALESQVLPDGAWNRSITDTDLQKAAHLARNFSRVLRILANGCEGGAVEDADALGRRRASNPAARLLCLHEYLRENEGQREDAFASDTIPFDMIHSGSYCICLKRFASTDAERCFVPQIEFFISSTIL